MVILANEQLEGPVDRPPGEGWAQRDTRRLLRAAFSVSNLDASVQFYNRYFNLLLLAKLDLPGEPVQRALVAAGTSQLERFALELRCKEGAVWQTPASNGSAPGSGGGTLPVGDWLSHFTVAVPDAPGVVQALRQEGRGALVVEELSAVIPVYSQGGSKQDKVSLVRDLDGYPWQLLELHGARAQERLCTVSIRVRDLASSLRWYQDVLGMRVLQKYESTGTGHLSALLGYTPELEGTLLELRQGREPLTEEGRGTAFGWFVVGTGDLSRTMVDLEVEGEDWEKVEIPSCDNPTETQDAAFVCDPDGWRFCLVQQPVEHSDL